MIVTSVASEPVPDVVGIATSGGSEAGIGLQQQPEIEPGFEARIPIALAASSWLPPPKPMMKSAPHSR